jgi:hypothetical protein
MGIDINTYKHLLSQLGKICQFQKELSRLSGADFNVFRVVKVAEDEVRHSAFLTELLNPKGSHGQGDIFLKLFIKAFDIKHFQSETAIAEAEKYIGHVTETSGGQIDIFIDDKQGNCITIENKIYAEDQDYQLIRYSNYCKQNFRNHKLLYLNLLGENATKKSYFNEKTGEKLEEGKDKDYELRSYKIDVLEWLKLCQKESATMPLIREGIGHYINLIKYLTGETTNKAMQKEIIELITDNPTNLKNANELVNNWSEAKADIQWKFWEALKASLELKGVELEEIANTVTKKKISTCYEKKFAEKYTHLGLYGKIIHKSNFTIRWGCEVGLNIYFGFMILDNNNFGVADKPENYKFKNIILECDRMYKTDMPRWIGWNYTDPILNFYEFKSEAIFSLANKEILTNIVDKIAEKSFNDIQFVQRKLKEFD